MKFSKNGKCKLKKQFPKFGIPNQKKITVHRRTDAFEFAKAL